jgi:phage tail-like protein
MGRRSTHNSRKDIIIEEIEELTKNVVAYTFFGCWVSEYQAISTFGSNSIAVAIEHINIENDGWIRINVAMEENK